MADWCRCCCCRCCSHCMAVCVLYEISSDCGHVWMDASNEMRYDVMRQRQRRYMYVWRTQTKSWKETESSSTTKQSKIDKIWVKGYWPRKWLKIFCLPFFRCCSLSACVCMCVPGSSSLILSDAGSLASWFVFAIFLWQICCLFHLLIEKFVWNERIKLYYCQRKKIEPEKKSILSVFLAFWQIEILFMALPISVFGLWLIGSVECEQTA